MLEFLRSRALKSLVSTSALATVTTLGALSTSGTACGQDVANQPGSTPREVIQLKGLYWQSKAFEPISYSLELQSSLDPHAKHSTGALKPAGKDASPTHGWTEVSGSNGVFVGSKINFRPFILNQQVASGSLDANVTHLRSVGQSEVMFGGYMIKAEGNRLMILDHERFDKVVIGKRAYRLESRKFNWNFEFGDLNVSGPQNCSNLHDSFLLMSSFSEIACEVNLIIVSKKPNRELTGRQVAALLGFLHIVLPQSGTFALTSGAPP